MQTVYASLQNRVQPSLFKARHTDDAGWCRQYAGRNIAGARTDGKILRLKDGDIIIMVSDGVLEEIPGYDKEETMCRFCEKLDENNPKEIAKILAFAGNTKMPEMTEQCL